MPKISANQIEWLPEDRYAIDEQSPNMTSSKFVSIFNQGREGDVQEYFKFLKEMTEKDPDVIQAIDTRTSEVTSKEWTVEGPNAEVLEKALRAIKGDPIQGLISLDDLIVTMLGASYLTGVSVSEIVTDDEGIIGFNYVPSHFLTYRDVVWYPKLWTQQTPTGVEFNKEKMIIHYLNPSNDPTRGYLGYAVGIQFLLKKGTLEDRLNFQKKHSSGGTLAINLQGQEGDGSYDKDFEIAQAYADDPWDTQALVFSHNVQIDTVGEMSDSGDYYFEANDDYKKNIVKIILGQTSTSDSDDSNRSTASVHMEVLETRTLDDIDSIENTINTQFMPKLKALLNISENDESEFKFVRSELEQEMDEDTDGLDASSTTIKETSNENGSTRDDSAE